jgi:hypothetical protein
MSAGTIMKKIQTLEDTIESLRQQLVFTRSEEEQISSVIAKKNIPKQPKQPKEIKEKIPAATKQKKTQNAAATDEEKDKDKIPMPWTGLVDFTTCVGLKAQYGLYIQCGKACDTKSASFQIDNHECRFCNDCSKKCDENGKHPVGTIEERIEAGVGKYVNAKTGKKETMYIEALEKMGITKEQALESAAKRGFQIPDWMLEKTEKKRGRPAGSTSATTTVVAGSTSSTMEKTQENETKVKKPRQPRMKKTASVATTDTPQKKNSVQSSSSVDLNDVDVDASVTVPAPEEKKKRGRPTKSNTQNNVAESEMQKLIVLATTEKKKRLSLDPEHQDQESDQGIQLDTQLTFENNEQRKIEDGEDVIFEMFDELMNEEQQKQQQQNEEHSTIFAAATVTTSVDVASNDKTEKTKKTKKSEKDVSEKSEKKNTTTAAKKKKAEEEAATAAAAKKKAEEEAAAAAAAASVNKENDDETEEDEESEHENEEEEELECEEYEYEGETYGLAPNGEIYSQDGNLVGKLSNGIPKMF